MQETETKRFSSIKRNKEKNWRKLQSNVSRYVPDFKVPGEELAWVQVPSLEFFSASPAGQLSGRLLRRHLPPPRTNKPTITTGVGTLMRLLNGINCAICRCRYLPWEEHHY